MKTFARILIMLLVALSSISLAADWYAGVVHTHSKFSDGGWSPEEIVQKVIENNGYFLIFTDHYEQIEGLDRKMNYWGFTDYTNSFRTNKIVVIPGVEIQTLWGKTASHTLAIGPNIAHYQKIDDLQNKWNTQQELINFLKTEGFLTIAAHPYSHFPLAAKWRTWEGTDYFYDQDHAQGVQGIEFFNDGDSSNGLKTRDWYLSLVRQNQDVFVTAGCDSHSRLEPGDDERWQRKTWVYAEHPVLQKSIIQAMSQGKTYAACYGAYIKEINFSPGFEPYKIQDTKKTRLKFTVAFTKPINEAKKVRVYLNGNCNDLNQIDAWGFKKGTQELTVQTSGFITDGSDFSLVIEIEDCLITSPIRFNLDPTVQPNTNTPNQITNFTGGVPILLGKTQEEVIKITGETPVRIRNSDGVRIPSKGKRLYWDYIYAFKKYKTLKETPVNVGFLTGSLNVIMDFSGYANNDKDNIVDGTKVHSVRYSPALAENLSAKRFVPQEILAIKPSIFGRRNDDEYGDILVVVWFIDNKTYVLVVNEKKGKLYNRTEKKIDYYKVTDYSLNENTQNFMNIGSVSQFICIDTIVDIRNPEFEELYGCTGGVIEYPDGVLVFGILK